MKLVLYKFKHNDCLKKEILYKDIPTLGIAFTCIDNYCHDNNKYIPGISSIIKTLDKITVKTKNIDENDDINIIFDIM